MCRLIDSSGSFLYPSWVRFERHQGDSRWRWACYWGLCPNTSLLLPVVAYVVFLGRFLIGLVLMPWYPCCLCPAVGGVMVSYSLARVVGFMWLVCLFFSLYLGSSFGCLS